MGKDKSRKESVAKSSERSSGSKHRSRSEERRKHKHSKRKHKKEKKSSKDDDKASRSGTDAIVVAAQAGRVTEEIASEDFFRLSEEFRVWLHMTAKR